MKKAISLIMSLCLVLSAVTVGSLASDAPTNIFYYENTTVVLHSYKNIKVTYLIVKMSARNTKE